MKRKSPSDSGQPCNSKNIPTHEDKVEISNILIKNNEFYKKYMVARNELVAKSWLLEEYFKLHEKEMSLEDRKTFEDFFASCGVLLQGVLDLGFTAIIEPLSLSDQLSLIAASSHPLEQGVDQVDFNAATQVCSQTNTLPDLELPLIAAPAKSRVADDLE